jgi:PAS domain S-box-containing protein
MTIPIRQAAPVPGPSPAARVLAGLFRDSPVPMAFVDVRSRRVVRANTALERLLGHTQGQLEGRALRDLDSGDPEEVDSHLLLSLACGDHRPQRRSWVTASGRSVPVEVLATRLDGDQGTVLALYVRDVLAHPAAADDAEAGAGLEGEALRAWMAQKHESLGRLATGFAEELEGILGRVVRSAEVLQSGGSSGAAAHAGLGEILGAAREARALVRELLAYAGRQPVEVRTLSLNDVVADAENALREALPSDIGLLLRPCRGTARVSADRARLKEVLLHLVEHARESMPDGGYVVVATEEVELDEAFAREHPSTRSGPHALLAVSDTGRGMDEETQARIFEPFFSTRGRGAGSGMGLATVYGMVKQLGGSIWVTSRPGVGTTFRVYLPRVEEAAAATS